MRNGNVLFYCLYQSNGSKYNKNCIISNNVQSYKLSKYSLYVELYVHIFLKFLFCSWEIFFCNHVQFVTHIVFISCWWWVLRNCGLQTTLFLSRPYRWQLFYNWTFCLCILFNYNYYIYFAEVLNITYWATTNNS